VDDFEPFRRFVCSTLGQDARFQIIGQASDGLDAVRQAQELQPDLILLDIGLPKLDGIGAARRILRVVSKSKIIFVSQETSAEVVREAFSLGAFGYVAKKKAATELLRAIEMAILGKQFVGSGLADSNPVELAQLFLRCRASDLGNVL
jgi:DNA-binding NarL/FixJ family response regulator